MSRQRALELAKMRDELTEKFASAVASINQQIQTEEGAEEDALYKSIGSSAAELARQTDSTAAGVMAIRCFPRQGGPKPQ